MSEASERSRQIIAGLQVGEEITVLADAGFPALSVERNAVIIYADGTNHALLEDGTMLSGPDGDRLIQTGIHRAEIHPSPYARAIMFSRGWSIRSPSRV